MKPTSICLYTNGDCRATEFLEKDYCSFNNDGTVHYVQFIEGSTSIKLDKDAFYAMEFIERSIFNLTDESDVLLKDELGNYLTAII